MCFYTIWGPKFSREGVVDRIVHLKLHADWMLRWRSVVAVFDEFAADLLTHRLIGWRYLIGHLMRWFFPLSSHDQPCTTSLSPNHRRFWGVSGRGESRDAALSWHHQRVTCCEEGSQLIIFDIFAGGSCSPLPIQQQQVFFGSASVFVFLYPSFCVLKQPKKSPQNGMLLRQWQLPGSTTTRTSMVFWPTKNGEAVLTCFDLFWPDVLRSQLLDHHRLHRSDWGRTHPSEVPVWLATVLLEQSESGPRGATESGSGFSWDVLVWSCLI